MNKTRDQELILLRKYYELSQQVEAAIIDFDLQDRLVKRFRVATDNVREFDGKTRIWNRQGELK